MTSQLKITILILFCSLTVFSDIITVPQGQTLTIKGYTLSSGTYRVEQNGIYDHINNKLIYSLIPKRIIKIYVPTGKKRFGVPAYCLYKNNIELEDSLSKYLINIDTDFPIKFEGKNKLLRQKNSLIVKPRSVLKRFENDSELSSYVDSIYSLSKKIKSKKNLNKLERLWKKLVEKYNTRFNGIDYSKDKYDEIIEFYFNSKPSFSISFGYAVFNNVKIDYDKLFRFSHAPNGADTVWGHIQGKEYYSMPFERGSYTSHPFLLNIGFQYRNIFIGIETFLNNQYSRKIKTTYNGSAITDDGTSDLENVAIIFENCNTRTFGGFINIVRPINIMGLFNIDPGIKVGMLVSDVWYDEDKIRMELGGIPQEHFELNTDDNIVFNNFNFGGLEFGLSKRIGPVELSCGYFFSLSALLSEGDDEERSLRLNNTVDISIKLLSNHKKNTYLY